VNSSSIGYESVLVGIVAGPCLLTGGVLLARDLHVLHTGIAWEDLPREYGYGSGVTCWRRLRS
jgi:hypothetical protein